MSDNDKNVNWVTNADSDVLLTKLSDIIAMLSLLFFVPIICHSTHYLLTAKKLIPIPIKIIFVGEIFANALFCLACIGISFFSNNYLTNVDPLNRLYCDISVVLYFTPLLFGKLFIFLIFAFRVYITFRHSIFEISMKVFVGLSVAYAVSVVICDSAAIATQIVLYSPNYLRVTPSNTGNGNGNGSTSLIACDYSDNDSTLMRIGGLFYVLMDSAFAIYILYLFISRMRKLNGSLTEQNVIEFGSHSSKEEEEEEYTNTNTNENSSRMTTMVAAHSHSPPASPRAMSDISHSQINTVRVSVAVTTDDQEKEKEKKKKNRVGTNTNHKDKKNNNKNKNSNYERMRKVTKKHGMLSFITILISFLFIIAAQVTQRRSVRFIAVDLVVRSICLHLTHNISAPLWNLFCGCRCCQ